MHAIGREPINPNHNDKHAAKALFYACRQDAAQQGALVIRAGHQPYSWSCTMAAQQISTDVGLKEHAKKKHTSKF